MCVYSVGYSGFWLDDHKEVSTCEIFFFFKQKTAYEMRISDWSSDVCSSDLPNADTRDVKLEESSGKPEGATKGDPKTSGPPQEIGRASCRERVCQYV